MNNHSIPGPIKGRYFDGSSSNSVAAEFSIVGSFYQLKISESGKILSVEIDEISERLGAVPRKIAFVGGGMFETPDNDGVDYITGSHNSHGSIVSRLESSWKIAIFCLIGAALSLYAFSNYVLPGAANLVAQYTPSVVIDVVNSGTLHTVEKVFFKPTKLSQERQNELSALFDELVAINGQTPSPLQLLFRDGGAMGPNAIALPGGTIILTDQLEELAENDDELAGVFAHEIGHVEHRHSLKQIYRSLGIIFMLSMLGGDSGQLADQIVGQASLLQTLSYSRAYEAESDAHSVDIMIEAGRDPLAFVDLLDRVMAKVGGDKDAKTSWLSTHPANNDRRESVRKEIERVEAAQ